MDDGSDVHDRLTTTAIIPMEVYSKTQTLERPLAVPESKWARALIGALIFAIVVVAIFACISIFAPTWIYPVDYETHNGATRSSSSPTTAHKAGEALQAPTKQTGAPVMQPPPPPLWTHSAADDTKCGWDGKKLVGRCFGIDRKPTADLPANNPEECADRCCTDEKCGVWQYRSDRGCRFGEDVRIYDEGRQTPNWCDNAAPSPWSGRHLKKRTDGAGGAVCSWHGEAIAGQCFCLREEKTGAASAEACEEACCKGWNYDKKAADPCSMYQWRKDKGCFVEFWVDEHYSCRDAFCENSTDPATFESYVGGRKKSAPDIWKQTHPEK